MNAESANAYGGWSTDTGWEGWIGMRGTEVDLGKWRELSCWPHNSAREGHVQRQRAAAAPPTASSFQLLPAASVHKEY